jgi:hypothetical protein
LLGHRGKDLQVPRGPEVIEFAHGRRGKEAF